MGVVIGIITFDNRFPNYLEVGSVAFFISFAKY